MKHVFRKWLSRYNTLPYFIKLDSFPGKFVKYNAVTNTSFTKYRTDFAENKRKLLLITGILFRSL